MPNERLVVGKRVGRIIRQCLDEGRTLEIDGLGTFKRKKGVYQFVANRQTRVFIAYVQEDYAHARKLFDTLAARGLNPWLDRKKLLPGQNWPRAIEQAISLSDFFIACFSRRAISRKSRFNAELRYALDCAAEHSLDAMFVLPVRFDDCVLPRRVRDQIQYVDLHPDWNTGFNRILFAIEKELARRKRAA